MRKLDRTKIPPPISLSEPNGIVSAEKTAVMHYYAARSPWQSEYVSFSFKAYRERDVKLALRRLAGGNCAYCESKIGAVGAREVEHYRPKGGVTGVALHPGYWWLAHSWENLLPTCRDCNKSLRQHIVTSGMTRLEVEILSAKRPKISYGKFNQFDVRGTRAQVNDDDINAEDPLLIDPCDRDPALHLVWNFSCELTLIEPKMLNGQHSPYGEYTIKTCALNRAELVLDRIPALRPLRALRAQIVNRLNKWDGDPSELKNIMEEVKILNHFADPEQPYAGMAAAFLKQFEADIEKWKMYNEPIRE